MGRGRLSVRRMGWDLGPAQTANRPAWDHSAGPSRSQTSSPATESVPDANPRHCFQPPLAYHLVSAYPACGEGIFLHNFFSEVYKCKLLKNIYFQV